MKRLHTITAVVLALTLTLLGSAWAAESRDEKNIQKEATAINTTAGKAEGETIVVQRLEKEFKVTDTQIQRLRDQKLGYGEIAIVLSLSDKMPGGITDTNIAKVMTLRQGPPTMGWGEVANKLGTKLGPAVSQVKNINHETSREMKEGEANSDMGKSEMHQGTHDEHGEMSGHAGIGGSGMSQGRGR